MSPRTHELMPRRLAPLTVALAVLAVACENPQAPISCGPIPQQTINVGESTSVSLCFNDANGDVLAYSATSSNPSVATASAAGSSVTVTAVSPGNASITITARDPGGLQATAVANVRVPNRAPRAVGTIAPLTVASGETATVDVSGNFMEPDGQTLRYSASSSNPSVATATASGSTVTVTAVGRGRATITVTATDPGGESATQSFQVTVPNRAPEPRGSIPAVTVEAGKTTTVGLSSYFTDVDGDALTYTASSSATAVATVAVSGTTLTVTAVAPGTATVTVTAADPDGESATQRFQVTVPNRPPEALGTIPGQTLIEGGTKTLVLQPYFTDPDGDALTYTATSANPAVAVGTVSGGLLTIRATGTGFSAITITARDPGGLTAIQIATVVVSARNRAPQPQGSIPAQSVTAGRSATVNLTSYFTDPDGDALTYTASSANPAVATASAAGATLTISGQSPGSTTVTVTARDPGGLTATQSISVSVGTAAMPDLLFSSVTPTAVTIAPGGSEKLVFTIRNAGNGNSAATSARAHQSPDARITTSDRVASNPIAVRQLVPNGTTSLELTIPIPADFQPGSFYVGMCVDPVTGESNTANNCSNAVRVTVSVGNRAPEPVGAIPALSVTGGQSVTADLSLYFTDPDGDPLSYMASSSSPGVATVAVTGSTLTVRGVAQGSATITVVASDPGGLTAAQSAAVSVAASIMRLTNNSADDQYPDWSPDGTKIAFTSDRDGDREIYVIDKDGSNPTRLTNNSARDEHPAWSPDGTKIAFRSTRDGNGEIYVMDRDGSYPTNVTNSGASDRAPAWSPDGRKIAFESDNEIYVMDKDGSSPTRLTNNNAQDEYPAWSPDGTRIAFASTRDGNVEIYVMNADGSNPVNLTNHSRADWTPTWSPDGTKIAFQSHRDGPAEIYVMNADGSNPANLTNDRAYDWIPDWSPDGTKIAFVSNRDGNDEIYVISVPAPSSLGAKQSASPRPVQRQDDLPTTIRREAVSGEIRAVLRKLPPESKDSLREPNLEVLFSQRFPE